VLLLCQKNSAKLDQISKRQDELETIIIKQKDKIDEILSKFEEHKFNAEIGIGKKEGKDKGKKNRIEFYQVNICMFYYYFFVYPILILIINLIYITGSDSKIVLRVVSRTQATNIR
jgi:hypothetical protein